MVRDEVPLQIGELVVFDYSGSSDLAVQGTVVGHLAGDYVRVRWGDTLAATTHRRDSLRRAPRGNLPLH
jgi:hypothetical protein